MFLLLSQWVTPMPSAFPCLTSDLTTGGSDSKESARNAGDLGSIPGLGRSPRGGYGYPLQYSCLENPMDSLAGYSPWGCKELDMTEHLSTHSDHEWLGPLGRSSQ